MCCFPRQFIAMGADQRNAIRRALNEDAEKLLQEGDPNDPQLRRLKREIDEVNRLFDEFERRASGESLSLLHCSVVCLFVSHSHLHLFGGETKEGFILVLLVNKWRECSVAL